ncbi:hypothetical protein GCM10009662_29690 [Catellatospora coxensis]|uniref:Uncharacterized protein n=1 Tax=Catellatospora coxensis TaxID=310354 RepID=A0A8J3L3K7_9ACTN|nr:hypothetical protein Cco03nite_74840 [Catellatospora coxensis]
MFCALAAIGRSRTRARGRCRSASAPEHNWAAGATEAFGAADVAIAAPAGRVEAAHPALLSLRLLQARIHAAAGDVAASVDLYERLAADTPAGMLSADAIDARCEHALQLAIVGEVRHAEEPMRSLLEEVEVSRVQSAPGVALDDERIGMERMRVHCRRRHLCSGATRSSVWRTLPSPFPRGRHGL